MGNSNNDLFRCKKCGFVSNGRGIGVHLASQKHGEAVDRVIGGDWKAIRSARLNDNLKAKVVGEVKFDPKMVEPR